MRWPRWKHRNQWIVSTPDQAQATPDVLKQLESYAAMPTVAPPPDRVNDLPFASFIVMDSAVIDHMREIFAKGNRWAAIRRPSPRPATARSSHLIFWAVSTAARITWATYRYLQAVIDHFKGSYGRKSMAVRIGQHSWTLLNPAWADKKAVPRGRVAAGL